MSHSPLYIMESQKEIIADKEEQQKKELSKDETNVAKPLEAQTVSKRAEEPKSSLESIIESLANLSFLVGSVTEVKTPTPEDLKKMIGNNDEIKFVEKTKFDSYYSVWTDEPNRNYYIIRNSSLFITFSSFDEMISKLLGLLEMRMVKCTEYIREPEMIFLKSRRVYNPETLGYPTEHLLSNSISMDSFRTRLEDVCSPIELTAGAVRIKVIGDAGIIKSNMNLISFSMNDMARSRSLREGYMNEIARLTHSEKMILNPRNGFEFYLPSFDFNYIQGPFDIFRKAPKLRLLFMQTITMPHIFYIPIPTSELLKSASVNATRTGYAVDISARSFKPEYHEMYSAYILSMMCPGEIIFDFDFTSGTDVSPTLKGFAAIVARLSFMFDESTQFSNTTVDAQIAIDNAIINWGLDMNILVASSATTTSKFPLNGYKLNRATADEQNQFNFLKIRDGQGGACGNGNLYLKRSERMRQFFPEIAYRSNYVVDCDDFIAYRNGNTNKHGWFALNGADVFINKMPNASGYRGMLQVISTRIFEFFIRLNEYMRVHWYSIFRTKEITARTFSADMMQKQSVRLTISTDFLLAVPKGFNNQEWRPMMDPINKMRFESSFIRETNKIAYFMRYTQLIFERTGNLRSYPKRRLIAIACSKSPIYNFIRNYLYYSDEDKRIPMLLNTCISDMGIMGAFMPLLDIDTQFLHMYGMLDSVYVHCRLNPWNESVIKQCIQDRTIMMNCSDSSSQIAYDYKMIENLVRQKSFKSVFVNSTETPFYFKIILPYEIVHSVAMLQNNDCITKVPSATDSDVSYENNIKNSRVGLLLSSVDPRDYNFPDDYVPATYCADLYSIRGAEYNDIVFMAENFYSSLSSKIATTIALTKKDYRFISLYDVN
uniref:VP3 n=1 Tax=Zeugodacus cucurbitae orbivirus 2 TaxID=3159471 RepID=A0AAU7L0P2_9REOV